MTKACIDCGETKSIDCFAPDNRKAGRYRAKCRDCYAIYQREYYRNRTKTDKEYRERKQRWRKEYNSKWTKENGQKLREYLLDNPCIDCGESDPIVLTFDHRPDEDKKFNISDKATRIRWDAVLEEIKKCDVRCANCHMRQTAERAGWYSYLK